MPRPPIPPALFVCAALVLRGAVPAWSQVAITVDPRASIQEVLAAREVVRYTYARTGVVLTIQSRRRRAGIVVCRKDRALIGDFPPSLRRRIASLGHEQYILAPADHGRFAIVGGDDAAVLYGAYRYAEHLGVRFYLHGDTIPDGRIPLRIPHYTDVGKPLFAIRGINPFHDFPEGPDWWNRDDYLAIIGQLAKLRMNFIGLHTYPENGAGPEPTVWIGDRRDVRADGSVAFSYPTWWANTLRQGGWGYDAEKTSAFSNGAGKFFPSDVYGPTVMSGLMPKPATATGSNLLFDRTAAMLRAAFREAHALGVKTCVGTETPLYIPGAVQARLRSEGLDPTSPAGVRSAYDGIFTRISRAYPIDYYWLWTPEDWTWSGNTPAQLERTTDDMRIADEALRKLGAQIHLATCGWVLGPQGDRAALDRVLAKSVTLSAINQNVGNAPLDPAFGRMSNRSRWAIPWMENDPSLTAPELWAGRMLYDAADARRMGCDGLIGIHWRTHVLAPNISALAAAGWDQSYVPAGFTQEAEALRRPARSNGGAIGGQVAHFTAPVAGTQLPAIYQSVRYDMSGYDEPAPNGLCNVVLRFNEPFYDQPGKRVFGVRLQGKEVISSLDMFARAGQNHAIDFEFDNVRVTDGHVRVDFVKQTEFPCIAGIDIIGPAYARRINCGGPAVGDYLRDDAVAQRSDPVARTLSPRKLYTDFARANFGESVANEAGRFFASIDGVGQPQPAAWITGPGDIAVDPSRTADWLQPFDALDAWSRLRSKVKGPGNLERFDYWVGVFAYLRAMGHASYLRGKLDGDVKRLEADDPNMRARDAGVAMKDRCELARWWDRVMRAIESTVSSPGELGTIANLEQHVLLHAHFLDADDAAIQRLTGRPLPAEAQPQSSFAAPARIVVPTVRTAVAPGEHLRLTVIIPTCGAVKSANLFCRTMGYGAYRALPLRHLARSTYEAILPKSAGASLEYYIQASVFERGQRRRLLFPATAPQLGQTLVVTSAIPTGA